jgi:hypothetical protein
MRHIHRLTTAAAVLLLSSALVTPAASQSVRIVSVDRLVVKDFIVAAVGDAVTFQVHLEVDAPVGFRADSVSIDIDALLPDGTKKQASVHGDLFNLHPTLTLPALKAGEQYTSLNVKAAATFKSGTTLKKASTATKVIVDQLRVVER